MRKRTGNVIFENSKDIRKRASRFGRNNLESTPGAGALGALTTRAKRSRQGSYNREEVEKLSSGKR